MERAEEEKDLLRKLGLETIYTAKGHFKAGDLRRWLVGVAVWGGVVASLFDILNLIADDRLFDGLGLLFSMALLIWYQNSGEKEETEHHKAAELFLELHMMIRDAYFGVDDTETKALSERVRKLNKSKRPKIPRLAYKMARKAITKEDSETDNWFYEKA